jgi:hypothetical protein
VPSAPPAAAEKVSRRGYALKVVGAAAVCVSALALLVTSYRLPGQDEPTALAMESLHWGTSAEENYFHRSQQHSKANKWVTQLAELKQKQLARRKKEDAEYFSGVEKAFGKKAGLAMMSEFDGSKSKDQEADAMLAKLKVDNSKLKARKEQISRDTLSPHADKVIKQVDHTAKADKKHLAAVAAKKAEKAKAEAAAPKKASVAEKKSAVKEALKVAKTMGEHKAPVASDKKHEDKKHEAKAAPSKGHAKAAHSQHKDKKPDLEHPGVVADSRKIKKLVHEFHHAHGEEKKKLKARVMQLQQDIVSDFKEVTNYGVRASTKFAREEAKEKAEKK